MFSSLDKSCSVSVTAAGQCHLAPLILFVCISTQIRLAESSKYSAVHSLSWYLFSRSPSWYTPRPQRPFPGAVQKVSGVERVGVVCWDEEGIEIMSVGKWSLCIYGKFNRLFIFSPLNINSQMFCLIVGYDTVLNFAGGKVLEWENFREILCEK